MKNYDEMTADVLGRKAAYVKRRKKAALVITSSAFVVCIAILCVTLLPGVLRQAELNKSNIEIPASVANYSELYDVLASIKEDYESRYDLRGDTNWSAGSMKGVDSVAEVAPAAPADLNTAEDTAIEYSDTNLQTAGVQEADIIKTDGRYIYALSKVNLYILSAENGEMKLLSMLPRTSSMPKGENTVTEQAFEMYVTQNTLVVLKNVYSYDADMEENKYYEHYYYGYGENASVEAEVYDISNRANPASASSYGQDGYYSSSRMVGNILYLITTKSVYDSSMEKDDPSTFVPSVRSGETSTTVSATDIYLSSAMEWNSYSMNYLILSGIDTSAGGGFVSTKSLLGYGGNVYASLNNLYVTSYNSIEEDNATYDSTHIMRFAIADGEVTLAAEGDVLGTTLNQFSMDEYNGVFRIVTTVNSYEYSSDGNDYDIAISSVGNQTNSIYTLDMNLDILGSIEGLANDERVYSVRFDGNIGYFVTFRQVDPLFSVDLTDPKNPKILGELKIPGFSDYLHPYDDGLLLGLGHDADENTGRSGYLKLSMFDTSDPTNVTEKHKLLLTGVNYSEASYNHKAILIDSAKSIIAFPCNGTDYMVYSYSAERGFKLESVASVSIVNDNYYYGVGTELRGLFIADYLYVFTGYTVMSFDMTNSYASVSELKLAPEFD